MSQEPVVVNGDKPSVIYRYTQDTPATVVDGVPARDLTEFDLAAMGASQRLRIQMIAAEDNGAYTKVGDLPKGLSFDPTDEAVESEPLPKEHDPEAADAAPEPVADAHPAASSRKRG